MPDHPVPQGDDIILPDGTKVGSWNGEDVKDLQVEVQRIMTVSYTHLRAHET